MQQKKCLNLLVVGRYRLRMLGGEERRRHNTRDDVLKKGGTVLCGLFSVSSLNRVARGVKTELFCVYSIKKPCYT